MTEEHIYWKFIRAASYPSPIGSDAPAVASLIAWIVLGVMVGNHLPGRAKYIGLIASAMVLGSMMKVLPYQREEKVVDGPGMPLFVIAWVILIGLNSSR